MFKVNKNDISILTQKINRIKREIIPEVAEPWAKESAQMMKEEYIHLLETQGRSDSFTEPLSSATVKIYEQTGEPDGSGIRNHVAVVSKVGLTKAIGCMGIEAGKPSMIATIQNDGATIRVTEKMRGFLASNGIFLRKETVAIVIPGRESFSRALKETIPEAKTNLDQRLKNWWRQN